MSAVRTTKVAGEERIPVSLKVGCTVLENSLDPIPALPVSVK